MVGRGSPKPETEVQFLRDLYFDTDYTTFMISQEFRDMIATILPNPSEQESFFASFQLPVKKSFSINRHHSKQFEKEYPEFILSDSPFGKEFPDTVYVDRVDTSLALGKSRQHLTGKFYIQEVAAALPANILK